MKESRTLQRFFIRAKNQSLLCLIATSLVGCAAAREGQIQLNVPASLLSATPSYTCVTAGVGYDTLADCQTASLANCTGSSQTFPNGATAQCFSPVAGYQACQVALPNWDWIYTPYSLWCNTGTVIAGNPVYKRTRSIISCSSSICICSNPQVIAVTCSVPGAGVGQCGSYTPNPIVVSPTPAPCP